MSNFINFAWGYLRWFYLALIIFFGLNYLGFYNNITEKILLISIGMAMFHFEYIKKGGKNE